MGMLITQVGGNCIGFPQFFAYSVRGGRRAHDAFAEKAAMSQALLHAQSTMRGIRPPGGPLEYKNLARRLSRFFPGFFRPSAQPRCQEPPMRWASRGTETVLVSFSGASDDGA